MDVGTQSDPALERPLVSKLLHGSHCAINRHPCHYLRMDEVSALAADFPDAVVWLTPDLLDMSYQRSLETPSYFEASHAFPPRLIESVQYFAVDIQLQLLRGGIPNSHWLRT